MHVASLSMGLADQRCHPSKLCISDDEGEDDGDEETERGLAKQTRST